MSTSAVAASQDMPPSALLAALNRAQERIRILEQENNQLCQEIRWIDKLLAVPASIMSPSHKVTLRAAIKAYLSGIPDEQGLVSIESWNVCRMAGQSKDTFLKNLTYCAEKLGILRKQVERPGIAAGDFSATLSIGITDRLAHPEKYVVTTPRQHGGLREVCPHCHSDRLKKKVMVVCQDCGAIISEWSSEINPDAAGNLPTDNTQETQGQVADVDFEPTQEPTTPPVSADDDVDLPPNHSNSQTRAPDQQGQEQQLNQVDLIKAAAQLLVEIAGPAPVHIEMSARGPKKYYDVHRPLEANGACAHLQGWKTKGGWIRRPDGMTRALAYDADTEEGWEELKTAARFLTYGDYVTLLEPSPVGRGGHLWVLYSDLVQAQDAQRQVCQYAPMLGKVKEYWPGSPNKVRLPGGKYVKPGFAAWCKLYDAYGKLLASNGVEAAQVLLISQNPAEMVPEYPLDPEPSPTTGSPESVSVASTAKVPNCDDQTLARKEDAPKQAEPWVDQYWQQKYGRYLWFQFTPAQLADWYNARHSVQDILPPETNMMGLASWRGERTASVGYTKDGEGWVDFGASAERSDGKRDGGDALELAARVTQEPKPEVMREIARTLISEAKDALESAARDGQLPSVWVQAFMSPAGWKHFEQLCQEYGHQFSPSDGAETPSVMPQTQRVAIDTVSTQERDMTGTTSSSQEAYSSGESTFIGSTAPCQGQESVAALAAEISAEMGEPCHQCGCTLYYRSGPFVMCHWCYPRPLKFGRLSDAQRDRLRTLFSPARMQKRNKQQTGRSWSM